jgi:hypothetical protein
MALIYKESTFRPNVPGVAYDIFKKGTEAHRYANSSAIKPILSVPGTPRDNVVKAARAVGLMQVNGYYIIRNTFEGPGELFRMRPDIAGPLMVNPGEDVYSKLLGEENVDNQLLAGLIVLEDKYRAAPSLVRKGKYSDTMLATFGGYLGNGASDQLGTTPEDYAKSIVLGTAYSKANGSAPIYASSNVEKPNGPTRTAASGSSLVTTGCS